MSYKSPESLIRQIMAEGHAPALKIPEPDRVKQALELLHNSGIKSAAKKDDNTITVAAGDVELAYNIMDRGLMHGMIQAKPQVVSPEAIDVVDPTVPVHPPAKEPHPPEGGQSFGESCEELPVNNAEADCSPNLQLQKRTLVNRMENQLKKIDESGDFVTRNSELDEMIIEATDEELTQLDEISKGLLKNYIVKNFDHQDHLEAKAKEDGNRRSRKDLQTSIKRDKNVKHALDKLHGVTKVKPTNEEAEQLDELSKRTLKNYAYHARLSLADREWSHGFNTAVQAYNKNNKKDEKQDAKEVRGILNRHQGLERAISRLAKEEVLNELSTNTLNKYYRKANKELENNILGGDKKTINKRAKGLDMVDKRLKENTLNLVQRVVSELYLEEGLRLVATHNSDCGKHSAKVYKDNEWGEHKVKFYINGKHHEPADYHTNDIEDAHDTAKAELGRMTKLNGALKEAYDEEIQEIMEDYDQLDEVSKALLSRYVGKAVQRVSDTSFDMGRATENPKMKNYQTSNSRRLKAEIGISKAIDKLSGEAKVPAK